MDDRAVYQMEGTGAISFTIPANTVILVSANATGECHCLETEDVEMK
ncbi:MAG: hypothetical protein WBQ89_20170 [Candidatus Acidiferrum sp.]